MELIKALKKDEALIAEMDSLLADREHYYLWWLGQSGFLLQWQGRRVLLDPYLSDTLTEKYAATDKPHTRMSERVVRPELLKGISVVTSSHNHTDHLDAATLRPVLANNPGIRFIIPEANRDFVCERIKCDPGFPTGLNDGISAKVDGFIFHGIPAKHNEIDRDEKGQCRYMGFVVEFDGHRIYHSGDTLWFDEMTDILKPFKVQVALLPINGNKPERKVAGNLDCREAAALGAALGVKCTVPCHYDMFTFNTADVKEFVKEAAILNLPCRVLQGGEFLKMP